MMAKLTDTFARAYAACDEILINTGKFPTVESVREVIGGNSPATINGAIKKWKEDFAEKHFRKLHHPDLPPALLETAEQLWHQAVVQAEQVYLAKEKQFENQIREQSEQIGRLEQELANRQAGLTEALALLDQARQAAEAMQAELNRRDQRLVQQDLQLEQLKQQLDIQQKQLETERAQFEVRREQDQTWFARRVDEEKDLAEQRWQDKVSQREESLRAARDSETLYREQAFQLRQENKQLLKEKEKAAREQHKPFRPGGTDGHRIARKRS